jgi:hypothetical protein
VSQVAAITDDGASARRPRTFTGRSAVAVACAATLAPLGVSAPHSVYGQIDSFMLVGLAVAVVLTALYGPDKSSMRAFWLLGREIPACLLRELDSVHRRGKADSKREGRNPRKHRRVR